MTNTLNPDSLDAIIDKVKRRRMKANYGLKGTRAELIKTWIIADVYLAVLRYIGLSEYDGNPGRRIKDMNSRRMAELVDIVERHWEGGICLPEHLLNEAIAEAVEHARTKGELKDDLIRAQQLVGPERRERVSHQTWCGEGWMISRRPVNSDVGLLN